MALAVSAALLLNLLLSAEFVWTEWLSDTARLVGWLGVLAIWGVSAGVTWHVLARERTEAAATATAEPAADPLASVIDEYLQGKWYEAERLLRGQVRRNRKDVEAMLMLATLCRHTGRLDEAERRLEELAALEAANKWQVEIAQERKLVKRRRMNDKSEEDSQTGGKDVPDGKLEMNNAA